MLGSINPPRGSMGNVEMHEMDEGRHDKDRRWGGGGGVKAHPRSLHQQDD